MWSIILTWKKTASPWPQAAHRTDLVVRGKVGSPATSWNTWVNSPGGVVDHVMVRAVALLPATSCDSGNCKFSQAMQWHCHPKLLVLFSSRMNLNQPNKGTSSVVRSNWCCVLAYMTVVTQLFLLQEKKKANSWNRFLEHGCVLSASCRPSLSSLNCTFFFSRSCRQLRWSLSRRRLKDEKDQIFVVSPSVWRTESHLAFLTPTSSLLRHAFALWKSWLTETTAEVSMRIRGLFPVLLHTWDQNF